MCLSKQHYWTPKTSPAEPLDPWVRPFALRGLKAPGKNKSPNATGTFKNPVTLKKKQKASFEENLLFWRRSFPPFLQKRCQFVAFKKKSPRKLPQPRHKTIPSKAFDQLLPVIQGLIVQWKFGLTNHQQLGRSPRPVVSSIHTTQEDSRLEPEDTGPPGKGKSSSKPSFSGSMLIFWGVPLFCSIDVNCPCSYW